MSRTIRHSWQKAAVLITATLLSTVGCRQLGIRSQQGAPTPLVPSAPSYSAPADSPLPAIPPMPPSSASIQETSVPRKLAWNRLWPTKARSAAEAPVTGPSFGEPTPLAEVEAVSGTEVETVGEEVALLLPPEISLNDEELVPTPSDAEDDLTAPRLPMASQNIVELDVTEFLSELEQTPAPIKAVTMTAPVVVAPQSIVAVQATTIEPWAGNTHGITVTPGPTGTGNRLELYPVSTPTWNAGRIGSAWGSLNSWAGQNSDWGGRQFR